MVLHLNTMEAAVLRDLLNWVEQHVTLNSDECDLIERINKEVESEPR